MEDAIEVLKTFCSENDNWYSQPFTIGNYNCATDAHSLIFVKGTGFNPPPSDKVSYTANLLQLPKTDSFYLDFDEIEKAISSVEMIEEVIELECKECDGSGEVEWNYLTYEKYFDCPVCDGSGNFGSEKTGNLIFPDRYIVINNSKLRIKELARAVSAFKKMCGNDVAIECFYEPTTTNPIYFNCADVSILIMPCSGDCDNVILNINGKPESVTNERMN